MSTFSVTASQLKAKAEELKNLNESFKRNVTELEGCEQTLMGQWDGQAKEAFHQAFNNDKIQMTNFSTLIDKYVCTLLAIAAKYMQAETENIETATTRSYK